MSSAIPGNNFFTTEWEGVGVISLHILVNLQLTKAPKKTDKKNVLVWYQTSASQSNSFARSEFSGERYTK